MDLVKARADRILRKLHNYKVLTETAGSSQHYLNETDLLEDEVLLGVYENNPERAEDSIVVSTIGIRMFAETGWQLLPYKQIESSEAPEAAYSNGKHNIDYLVLCLESGESVNIPVRGGSGRFRDAWEFLRFLRRTTADLRKS